MGYWEQIGADNRRHRERRARMNPRHRVIRDAAGYTLIAVVSIVLWIFMLWPLVQLAGSFF